MAVGLLAVENYTLGWRRQFTFSLSHVTFHGMVVTVRVIVIFVNKTSLNGYVKGWRITQSYIQPHFTIFASSNFSLRQRIQLFNSAKLKPICNSTILYLWPQEKVYIFKKSWIFLPPCLSGKLYLIEAYHLCGFPEVCRQ